MSAAANSSVRAPPTPSRTRRARRTALWKWQPGWHPASAALPETDHPPGTACVSIARQATTRSTSRPRAPTFARARARGFLERRVTRLSLPALRPRPRPTVPSPSVEWLKKYPLPSIALQAYWRIAGMSYLKYSNMCAEVVRASLKEPFFTKVRPQSLSPPADPPAVEPASPIPLARPDPTRRRRR